MGAILRSFTFDRNTLKANTVQSSLDVERHIRLAESGKDLTKGQSNIVGALRSYTGVLDKDRKVTPVGAKFLDLFAINAEDAWRWLLTRSLWLYGVPNGTRADVNAAARSAGQEFSFFSMMLGVLTHLSTLPGADRYFYYDELCSILDDDKAWSKTSLEIFTEILTNRSPSSVQSTRTLLGDLEDQYGISRDNLNTVLNKAFQQTGLFSYAQHGGGITGIALSENLDPVLRGRVRYILDNPPKWNGSDWEGYLSLGHADFPDDVSYSESAADAAIVADQEGINGLLDAAVDDFEKAGLYYHRDLVLRFVSSLLAKRFLILTGLSGSGKTKLAQAFAMWISAKHAVRFRFKSGDVLSADRIEYKVTAADDLSVELESGDGGTRVALPYALIDEWISVIQSEGFDRSTSARAIRDKVTGASSYSSQLSSFETHLKAAAFAILEQSEERAGLRHYEIVAVGPDWTARESCFGYIDALNDNRFVRTTPIVELILRAISTPERPFFLVLDEMNLSHVERYFADFLSAAESQEVMHIHGGLTPIDGVPPTLSWPQNLFVIGTVNIDETTYMFSPKVLDRANTVEFRVREDDLNAYLDRGSAVSLGNLETQGLKFSDAFVSAARASDENLDVEPRVAAELRLLFEVLQSAGLEFGFRTAREMARFFRAYNWLEPANHNPMTPVDAQILQKVLPKLSGSRRRLEGPLCSLGVLSTHERVWDENTGTLLNMDEIRDACARARSLSEPALHPLSESFSNTPPVFPLSFEKIVRMLRRLDEEGFTSFAES